MTFELIHEEQLEVDLIYSYQLRNFPEVLEDTVIWKLTMRALPSLIAHDIVGVSPMVGPSPKLIEEIRFRYNPRITNL